MDDKFLNQFQEAPRTEFSDGLWDKLQRIPPAAIVAQNQRKHRYGLAFALGLFTFLLLVGFSPEVRGQVEAIVRQLGGIAYKETAVYPGVPEEEITIVENEVVKGEEDLLLADARRRLGLDINLPASLPERFTRFEDVIFGDVGGRSATFRWQDALSYYVLVLDVRRYNPETNWVVGPDSTTEMTINGQPAALITGGWNADTKEWDSAEGAQSLRWQQSGIEYSLTMFGSMLTIDEFIAIAESIE